MPKVEISIHSGVKTDSNESDLTPVSTGREYFGGKKFREMKFEC